MHNFEHTLRENICNECDTDYEWHVAIKKVIADLIRKEECAEMMIEDPMLPKISRTEWANILSGLYYARTKLEELLDQIHNMAQH